MDGLALLRLLNLGTHPALFEKRQERFKVVFIYPYPAAFTGRTHAEMGELARLAPPINERCTDAQLFGYLFAPRLRMLPAGLLRSCSKTFLTDTQIDEEVVTTIKCCPLGCEPGGISRPYRDGYHQRITAYLHSHFRLAWAFVVGPSNFPVAQMQKRGQSTDNKLNELVDWSRRARAAIKEKILEMRPQEQKDNERWETLAADLRSSLKPISEIDQGHSPYSRPLFVSSIVGKVERLAMNGETELVNKALALVTDYNANHPKAAITSSGRSQTSPMTKQKPMTPSSTRSRKRWHRRRGST
ncbi:hypothetical protein BH10PLA2_BH10PLA2_12240 [soil metagenome]